MILQGLTLHGARDDPGEIMPHKLEPREGVETFIAHTSSDRDIAGYDFPVEYSSLPKSDYQARLRWHGHAKNCPMRVENHTTPLFGKSIVEK